LRGDRVALGQHGGLARGREIGLSDALGWSVNVVAVNLNTWKRLDAKVQGLLVEQMKAFEGTMRTTAMIMAILVAAYFLNFVITSIGLTTQVNRFITSLGPSPTELLIVVNAPYIILGMFMETLSMMVATVLIIAPIMLQAGFDPIWFGIMVILLMETSMITPPVGINLRVVQGLRTRGKIDDVIIGTLPFVATLVVMLVLMSIFPNLALFLPHAASD
jgi:TRAP-type C4-dicarboxylate transport system permease large subunit